MRKVLVLSVLLVLVATLLWGCNAAPGAQTSSPTEAGPDPVTATDLYYNLDKGATLTPDANGAYKVNFLFGTEKKAFTVKDKTLLDNLLQQDFVGLQLEGNTVTGFARMTDMPYKFAVRTRYVQNINGTSLKLNVLPSLAGSETDYQMPQGVAMLDLIPNSDSFGTTIQLQERDCLSVITDKDGKAVYAYITARTIQISQPREGLLYCEHCKEEVSWFDWLLTDSLPVNAGHYLLAQNIELTETTSLSNAEICLDLNGKNITQKRDGHMIYQMGAGAKLSLMDSKGTGIVTPATSGKGSGYTHTKGLIIRMESAAVELNIYGGTYDATGKTAQHGACIDNVGGTLNIYDGTFLGGKTFGAGGGVLCVQSVTNIYGGTFTGGHCTQDSFETKYSKGGGTFYVGGAGTLNVYGGTIQGGKSDYDGGTLYSNGVLNLYGGTIAAGETTGRGSAFGVSSVGSLSVNGNIQVTGSMVVDADTKLETGADCPYTVTRNPDGTLVFE